MKKFGKKIISVDFQGGFSENDTLTLASCTNGQNISRDQIRVKFVCSGSNQNKNIKQLYIGSTRFYDLGHLRV